MKMRDSPFESLGNAMGLRGFTARVLVVLLLFALMYFVWQVRHAFLLLVFGLLVAVVLHAAGQGLRRLTKLPHTAAVIASLVLIVALIAGGFWLTGAQLATQVDEMRQAYASGIDTLREKPWGASLVQKAEDPSKLVSDSGAVAGKITGFASTTFNVLIELVLIIFVGLYIALTPGLYQRGLLKLTPPRHRERVDGFLKDGSQTLRRWLMGRLVAMAAVGILASLAMWMLGVPGALALGILTGLLEFVPLIGPIVAAVPAILLGFTVSPTMAIWVALAYLVIFQLEGNVVTPIIEKRAVELPPVITLLAVVAFGTLFGPLGTIVGVPLAVLMMVATKHFYIAGALDEDPEAPPAETTDAA